MMSGTTQNGPKTSLKGDFQVVAWDLDTTGRRLIDEICQIGGFYMGGENSSEEKLFSQYVMPYKNPNPGARRSFGIRVVNIGRYRMLKDAESGRILKTKSEISALQEFIEWLKMAKGSKDGILLVCHEPTRKVLIPLLLEAIYRYKLMDSFNQIVSGFVNATDVVEKYGNKEKITSNSLRSLCKTVLNDTNPQTASASDRSKVIIKILTSVVQSSSGDNIDSSKLNDLASLVSDEEAELRQLKDILGTQGTLRPIFEGQLRQRRSVRERAMVLRKLLAESGFNYDNLSDMYKSQSSSEAGVSTEVKAKLKSRLGEDGTEADLEELVSLLDRHFVLAPTAASTTPTVSGGDTSGETAASNQNGQ